jgi:hypothetical protein
VAPASQYDRGWFRFRSGKALPRVRRSGRQVKGPRLLGAMCLHVLANNLSALPDNFVLSLPTHLCWELWNELMRWNSTRCERLYVPSSRWLCLYQGFQTHLAP